MNKHRLTATVLGFLITTSLFSASQHEEKARTPLIDRAFSSHTEDPKNKPWLADLRYLPSREEIEKLSKHVDDVMQHEKHKQCTSINPRLRKMIFLHFVIYQYMVNKRSIYLDEKDVYHWAHVFGMLLKESSGDSTNVSSMTGRSYTTYEAKTNLERWGTIAKLTQHGKIPLNYETNFGLTQLSVDRLFVAFKFAENPTYLKDRKKNDLNTAIATRRLIWFYQDFAQGRLTQDHDRIHHHERGNPEYSIRLTFGTSMALLMCGTNYMFYEGYHEKAKGVADLTEAMTSIAYCKLGNSEKGYGTNAIDAKCFAEWVTLCPTLNFDIALITPLKYFSTRDALPVCEATFTSLLNKKPMHHARKRPLPNHIHHNEQQEIKTDNNNKNTRLGRRLKKLFDSASHLLTNIMK